MRCETGPPDFEDHSKDEPSPPPRVPQSEPKPDEHPDKGILRGLKSVRKLFLKDRRDKPQPKRPAAQESDYAPSSGDEGKASEPAGTYGPHAAAAPLTPPLSEDELAEAEFWQQVTKTRTGTSRSIPT